MVKYTIYHPAVFFLTFASYACYHAIRKTLSNVKTTLRDELTTCVTDVNTTASWHCNPQGTWNRQSSLFTDGDEAEEFFGVIDASFLFAYAVGLYVSGVIADRLDLRLVLSTGMVLVAVVAFVFGPVMEWSGTHSQPAYIGLMVVNGLLQSTGWPCVVAVMGNWFGKGSRGVVLGLWSSCQSVGNIIGALMVSAVLEHGYEYAFLLTSSAMFACGILVFFGLVPTPLEVGLPLPDEEDDDVVDVSKHMPVVYVDEESKGEKTVKDDVCNVVSLQGENNILKEATMNNESAPQSQSNGDAKDRKLIETHEQNGLNGKHISGLEATVRLNGLTNDTEKIPKPAALFNDVSKTEQTLTHDHKGANGSHVAAPGAAAFPVPPLEEAEASKPKKRPKAVGFLTALLLPGVIPYSLAYAFLKLVNYVFFFWLPFYLSQAYGWRESAADQLSTWYDVGGIIGGTVAGFISDRCGHRAVVVVPMLILGVPMLYIYATVSAGGHMLVNAIMLCCTGILLGGVANLISAAVQVDLGRQDAIRGNSEALSTVAGIIDGSGSLGAAVGQVLVPYLEVAFGWRSVFYLFMVAVLLTVSCITTIFIAEVKLIVRGWRQKGK